MFYRPPINLSGGTGCAHRQFFVLSFCHIIKPAAGEPNRWVETREGHVHATSQRLVRFVRATIAKEAQAGFARISRIPSTYTWRCLDLLHSFSRSHQEQLFDAFAERAPFLLGLEVPQALWQNPILTKFNEEVFRVPSRHVSARLLRGMAAAKRSDGPQSPFSKMPDAMMQQADSIRPTTASSIRKEVKQELGQHFGATPLKQGAGNWLYPGESSGRRFSVTIDYGGQVDQLRYFVEISDPSTGLDSKMLTYEGLLGLGFGRWDFLTADSQTEAIQLLCEFIQELVAIPDSIMSPGFA